MLESEYIYDYLETICLYIDNGWNLFRARGKSGDQAFPKLCLDSRQDIHTPEPMDVVVIRMNGKVAYRGEVTDGQRIMVPSGIYAVNGQLVRVK